MDKTRKAKILVVEDERSMREVLTMLLEGEGYSVVSAADGQEGIDWLGKDIFDLVITDIKMPGRDGFEVLGEAMKLSPGSIVLMITAFSTMESTIRAMKLGAYDYISKPFKIDEIRVIVKNALEKRMLASEVSLLRETVKSSFEVHNLIGKSAPMHELQALISKAARTSSNTLVTGESGTGKELVAVALHNLSPRGERAFVAVNCASFPEGLLESELFGHMRGAFTGAVNNKQGLFEVADGGTLFLDEIAEMPLNLQSKLLRAIESGVIRRVGGIVDIKVDVRIIAATNRDLKARCDEGAFREDLFFRLNVIPIRIAPLRERKEDIPALIEHFTQKYSSSPRKFTGGALSILMEHRWQGNVRELENLVERLLLLTDSEVVTVSELPPEFSTKTGGPVEHVAVEGGVDLTALLVDLEKRYLIEALKATRGRKTEAAELLGLSFRSFRHKLSKYGIT